MKDDVAGNTVEGKAHLTEEKKKKCEKEKQQRQKKKKGKKEDYRSGRGWKDEGARV